MVQLNPASQVDVYRLVVELESRCQQLENRIAQLKAAVTRQGGGVSLPDVVAAIDSIRYHAAELPKPTTKLESTLKIQRDAPEKKPAAKPAAESSDEASEMRGSSSVLPIPDLISLLGGQHRTGTLKIRTQHGEQFVLEFLNGAVVHVATDTPLPSQMIGSILVAQNKLTSERLQDFLSNFSPENDTIGEALTAAQLVEREDLLDALEEQVYRLFQRIFALDSATFHFTQGPISDLAMRITLNTTQLLLEAARACDEQSRDQAAACDDVLGIASELMLGGKQAEPADDDADSD